MTSTPSSRSGKTPARIPGLATAEGTARFEARFAERYADDFYRALGRDGMRVSSVGLGSYLGECDDADDDGYAGTARAALERGVNLLDTAINYRCQRSERSFGRALAQVIADGVVARDEVVVCTKGGYIPLDGSAPATREEYQEYVTREYFERDVMKPDDVVGGGHCLAPGYLASQLERSRANLGLDAIDVYYVHNPEQQLDAVTIEELFARLGKAFELLEERCERGEIGVYGCATWNGFRSAPDSRGHLELADLVELAHEVAGDAHHFRVVQLPVNLAFTEAVRAPTQRVKDRSMTLIETAAALGVSVVASATLLQGKLAADLPAQLHDAIPGHATDAQRAIAFVRSLPVISAGLVGMKQVQHLEENLESAAV
ncbi:MAG TPA: aldo/keto reductase [Gemmatimonadaceae bacterium]|nr:aldo/keto reductase [Gemmatimonadaceae bacterium]